MGRYSSGDKQPRGLKPVKKIELSENNIKLRTVIVIVALAVALLAFGFAIYWMLDRDPGWQTVEVTGIDTNCSEDFIFNYDLGRGEMSANAEYREISALYTDMCELAYKLFNENEVFGDVFSVAYINKHVNEDIIIDSVLYDALYKFVLDGERYIYCAPVYDAYEGMFFGYNGSNHTDSYDPYLDSDTARYLESIIEYTGSASHITLDFLGDGRIRLNVSDEYLAFAADNEIETFVSFMWLKNAFIIDYFADSLIDAGYTNGTLSSYDGFTRNLDKRGTEYGYNLYDRYENDVYNAASMLYSGQTAIVFLKDYMLDDQDIWHYRETESGNVITPYIDGDDGLYKSATHNVVSYAEGLGCVDILLKLLPVYIADELDTSALNSLISEGIYSIYGDARTIKYNQVELEIVNLYEKDGVSYKTEYAN